MLLIYCAKVIEFEILIIIQLNATVDL